MDDAPAVYESSNRCFSSRRKLNLHAEGNYFINYSYEMKSSTLSVDEHFSKATLKLWFRPNDLLQ